MRTFTEEELHQVIAKHKDWLDEVEGGERADLSYADLSYANLSSANLRCANLRCANLRSADLRYADLSSADLSCADLRSADLSCADLRSADLRSAVGNIENIKSMQCDMWMVSYTDTMLNIGCQTHRITEWWRFSDDEISRMDSSALKWWAVWKPILQQIITASPAMPTGYMEKSE
jgi:hypothetical protein